MNAMMSVPPDDARRELALLKAVGLDRVQPEQRELALAIAKRYDLDLMLKHLVLIEGRPYVTRDGLLHIAHRSGALDGIETTRPVIEGDFWIAECSVYRKDMSRPFTYAGRYPTKGGNTKYAPEMATKVAESMALRRAFDIAAPSADERWDLDERPTVEPEAPRTLAAKIAERAAPVQSRQEAPRATETPEPAVEAPTDHPPVPAPSGPSLTMPEFAEMVRDISKAEVLATAKAMFADFGKFADLTGTQLHALAMYLTSTEAEAEPLTNEAGVPICGARSPLSGAACNLDPEHAGVHRAGLKEAW